MQPYIPRPPSPIQESLGTLQQQQPTPGGIAASLQQRPTGRMPPAGDPRMILAELMRDEDIKRVTMENVRQQMGPHFGRGIDDAVELARIIPEGMFNSAMEMGMMLRGEKDQRANLIMELADFSPAGLVGRGGGLGAGLRLPGKSGTVPTGSGGAQTAPSGVPGIGHNSGVPQPLPTYPPTVSPKYVTTSTGLKKSKIGTSEDKQWAHDQNVAHGLPAKNNVYPKHPISGVETPPGDGPAYPATPVYAKKQNSPQAEAIKKQVLAAQNDINAGNYKPMFDVSKRTDVDPTKYKFGPNTRDVAWAKTDKYKDLHRAAAHNPEGLQRLEDAFKAGTKIPDASNWYYMGQLEKAFIKSLGAKKGRAAFREKFARAMAATTSGATPKENFRTAMYGNYLKNKGLNTPPTYAMNFPAGGEYIGSNMQSYDKLMRGKGASADIDAFINSKRADFERNFLGDVDSATIDKQMSQLFDPKLSAPKGSYGAYENVVAELAKKYGVTPREFQEVAWAGAKKGREGAKYPGSQPMIQTVNEAIERTARVTGMSPADVLEHGIIRSDMPIYGSTGVPGAGLFNDMLPQEAEPEQDGTLQTWLRSGKGA